MKPIFSDEERCQAVRIFLVACHNKKAKIVKYDNIRDYLNTHRVTMLCKLAPSGRDSILDSMSFKTGRYEIYYTDGDAQTYWEWLVSVVNGTMHEDLTGDIIKQANDQLFHFIHIMQNSDAIKIDQNVQMIAPYDWQNLFLSFDKELVEIRNTVDRHDKEIVNILKSVLESLKKNKELLQTLQKEYEEYFPKGDA